MEIKTEIKMSMNKIQDDKGESSLGSIQKSEEDIKTLFGIIPSDVDCEKELEEKRNTL